MSLYRLLSALLCYPEQELLDALTEVEGALAAYPEAEETLQPLIGHLASQDLIALQEAYVATFDRNRAHSLHLFEHVHGESRDRGQAMVDLLETYRQHGFEPVVSELPDHVPLFLEFLGVIDPAVARDLLDDAIHVLAAIGARLARNESPYARAAGARHGRGHGDLRRRRRRRRTAAAPVRGRRRAGRALLSPGAGHPLISRIRIMNSLNQVFFGIYPYIALTVFLLGSLARFEREQYTWKTDSSQLLHRGQLRLGNILFHVGILGLFFGHLVGLLTPVVVWDTLGVSHTLKQTVAMVAGGVMGGLCLIGLLILIHRRLSDPRIRKATRPGDKLLLAWILATLLLGLSTIALSAGHMDGEMMVRLMHWAQHIVTFRSGAADFVAEVPPLFKAHLFMGLTLFVIFPFTRLVHVWSGFASLGYLGRAWQLVRPR